MTRESTEADPRPGAGATSPEPWMPRHAPRVVIELESPFAEPQGGGVLGGLDVSKLSPEQREKLEKLGYLDTSANKAN